MDLYSLHETYDSIKVRDKFPYSQRIVRQVYPRYFSFVRNKVDRVLEIGAYKGGSIQAMRDYFPHAEIVAFDIRDQLEIEDWRRITFVLGDQSKPDDLRRVAEEGPFDIIIDDGSHDPDSQITTLGELWPHLTPGGLYFIEDMIPRWSGDKIFNHVRNMVTEEGFVTTKAPEIESIHFHQGVVALIKK